MRHRSGKTTALRPGTRVLAAGLLCLLAAVAPRAEPPSAPPLQPEQWRDLPPEQRHQMRQRYLRSLPEAERKRLRDRAERFRSLPESSQRELCRDFQAERGYLPPACRRLLGR